MATTRGQGHTIEGQLTGEEKFGGLQLKVFEGYASRFPEPPPVPQLPRMRGAPAPCAPGGAPASVGMGLAAGGRMKQKVYPDTFGPAAFDEASAERLFIHLVDAASWRDITGELPPPSPIEPHTYAAHGYPWYDVYDEEKATLEPTPALKSVQSLESLEKSQGYPSTFTVSDGEW